MHGSIAWRRGVDIPGKHMALNQHWSKDSCLLGILYTALYWYNFLKVFGINPNCSTEADLKKWMIEKVKTEVKSDETPVANHTIS